MLGLESPYKHMGLKLPKSLWCILAVKLGCHGWIMISAPCLKSADTISNTTFCVPNTWDDHCISMCLWPWISLNSYLSIVAIIDCTRKNTWMYFTMVWLPNFIHAAYWGFLQTVAQLVSPLHHLSWYTSDRLLYGKTLNVHNLVILASKDLKHVSTSSCILLLEFWKTYFKTCKPKGTISSLIW